MRKGPSKKEDQNGDDVSDDEKGATSTDDTKKSRIEAMKAKKNAKKETKELAKSPPSVGKKPKAESGVTDKISSKKMAGLDFSSKIPSQTQSQNPSKKYETTEEEEQDMAKFIGSDDELEFNSDDEKQGVVKKNTMFSKLTNRVKNLTGNQQMTLE